MNYETLTFMQSGLISILEIKTDFCDTLEYISSGKAFKSEFIDVEEVSTSGSVNDLHVTNKSDKYIFFMDGDVLIGAKQNRVINTSVLLSPNMNKNISVSCIESGRWHFKTKKFSKPDYIIASKMRMEKKKQVLDSLDKHETHYADQRKIWNRVSDYEKKYNLFSSTSDFNEVLFKRTNGMNETLKNFISNTEANGLVLFLGNNLSMIEIFNRKDIYSEYFPQIINSVLMEKISVKNTVEKLSKEESIEKLEENMNRLNRLELKEFPGLGVGKEKRVNSEDFDLYELEFEGKPVHFSYMRETE